MRRFLEHDWFPEPLPDNVTIGQRSWLYSTFAFRHYLSQRPVGLRVGNDTGLYHGTFFDLGPSGEVLIGDFCTLVGAIICTNRRIVIADYVFIAHEVVLADAFAAVPSHRVFGSSQPKTEIDAPETGITIGENVWIGSRSVLLDGARIGEGAVVGAGAMVDFHVPPYTIVAGNPARVVRNLRDPNRLPPSRPS